MYVVIGFPQQCIPNPLSVDKFENHISYRGVHLGRTYNTRMMQVGMVPEKRTILLALLAHWCSLSTFTLLEAAQLSGILENHTRFVTRIRPWFFRLQNVIRAQFRSLYYWEKRRLSYQDQCKTCEQGLPPTIWKRIIGLVSRDMAVVTWHRKRESMMSDALAGSLLAIHDYLLNEETPWSAPIALVTPQDPHFFTVGERYE